MRILARKGSPLDSHEISSTRGKLIMAANSLGQSLDVPQRSLSLLATADLLIFEEDRAARQALKAAGIHRDYLRLSEHREQETLDAAKKALEKAQSVLFMSAQGMPTLADPGRELLLIAYGMNAQVQVIPGPSSITAALAACSFLENSFYFAGFLPRNETARRQALSEMNELSVPLIILDTPYRQAALLESAIAVFGEDRTGLLAEDVSGPLENYVEAPLGRLLERKGEKLNFVLVISPESKTHPKPKYHPDDKMGSSSNKAGKSAEQRPSPRRSAQPVKPREGQTNSRKQKQKRSPR